MLPADWAVECTGATKAEEWSVLVMGHQWPLEKERMVVVGIVTGGGTGRELVGAFKTLVHTVASRQGIPIDFVECPHTFLTYAEIEKGEPDIIHRAVESDLEKIHNFYTSFVASGGRTVFRSAINAETLYRLRVIGEALKISEFRIGARKILLVRDQAQGFYANETSTCTASSVSFTGSISRSKLLDFARFTRREADRKLRNGYDLWVVYKHHLFSNAIATWVKESGLDAKVIQPNHATDLLFNLQDQVGDIALLAGNEVGDILHEVILSAFSLGSRNIHWSKNLYLAAGYSGLIEYQTVHGSADEIGGLGLVNPFATLRAAGNFIEEELGCSGFSSRLEQVLVNAVESGAVTRDLGGNLKTVEVLEHVLGALAVAEMALTYAH